MVCLDHRLPKLTSSAFLSSAVVCSLMARMSAWSEEGGYCPVETCCFRVSLSFSADCSLACSFSTEDLRKREGVKQCAVELFCNGPTDERPTSLQQLSNQISNKLLGYKVTL